MDGSALCVECGLCCSGALFDHAPLLDGEVPRALELEMTVEEPPGIGLAFALPCPALDGTRCSAYPDRPAVCGDYSCALLDRYRKGEVTLAAALEPVRAVQAILRESSAAELDRVRRERRRASDPEAYAREHARALALGEALRLLLRANF
ncbi:MAG: YkgJ family cysteine cluster protein [Sorangiineae bacterium]|nr:YkgJ family cysteine cluster protein [Polyangiaceae bacterium]MEB2323702.1 YkgJ family cysteine cluster protein [Sorangiineae bacterium]